MTYVIVITREFYGPMKATRNLLVGEYGHRAERFATLKDAKAKIAELNGERYYLAHNESARPTYKARAVDGLPAYLQNQL
ncbi:hypothetical protein FB480_101869 [Agrobacterium vitis]|nr:hypothetical protein FB480_101869 [Agrobacterium vitis]